MPSQLFSINLKDLAKGLVVAILTGFALPILAMIQSPGFSFATADWNSVLILALNGAASGFAAYIIKNFISDENGKVLGRIG